MSAPARRAAARAGSLLAVFARAGDRLWLPSAAAGGEPTLLEGLPQPVLETGAPEALAPVSRVLAWGEGPRIAALRARWRAEGEPARDLDAGEEPALSAPLHEAVWHLPVPAPAVVASVADRSFCLELAQAHGWALPGARRVTDLAELERHLGSGGAAAGDGRWVVKAPYSAAGRERQLGHGRVGLAESGVRRRLEGLLVRHGSLLFEPWVERSADFGAAGLLARAGLRRVSVHRQEIGPRGEFRAILSGDGAAGLASGEREALEAAFHAVAEALSAAGYSGPFGLDAFRWRRPDGVEAFHPLCEVNPRLTFGLVARAIEERQAAGPGRESADLRMLKARGAR